MKMFNEELMNSEFVSIDEKGWHISDNAPEDLKKRFNEFIENAEKGIEIELK